jgi:hypothetical protein
METRIETMADGTIYSFPGIGMVKEENPKAGNGAIYLEAYMHAPSLLSGCHPPCLTFVPYNSPCPWLPRLLSSLPYLHMYTVSLPLAPQAAILPALPMYTVSLPRAPQTASFLPYLCTL